MNLPNNNMIRVHANGITISARILGSHNNDTNLRCRYWLSDPNKTGRRTPVDVIVIHCPVHQIFYVDRDFPTGCPNCHPSKTPRYPC
jgi:hypothetical protein